MKFTRLITLYKNRNKKKSEKDGAASKRKRKSGKGKGKDKDPEPEYDEVERLLRGFDLDIKYGPCLTLSRIERWERAKRQGLNPPQEIKDILEREDGKRNKCLWEGRS